MPRPFDAAFERHVWPALETRALVNGTHVATGDMGWAAAYDDLIAVAHGRGAVHLENPSALHDRLAALLLCETVKAEAIRTSAEATLASSPSAFWRYIWGFRR